MTLADDLGAIRPDLTDRELIEELEARGFVVRADEQTAREVVLDAPQAGHVRIGIASDTHLGHTKQQLTALRRFCKKAETFGVDYMLHGGDLVDGVNMHRDQQYELFRHGADAQANYAIEHLPEVKVKRRTVPWRVIGGNHDGAHWNNSGANILRTIADNRDDVEFLGAPVATFHLSGLRIQLMHPDGGVAYARSYKLQKIVEQMPPDEKPHILACGHWHISDYLPGYRNVHALALPCFQAQTAFMARKGLAPVIGGVLLDIEYNAKGLADVTVRWCLEPATTEKDF